MKRNFNPGVWILWMLVFGFLSLFVVGCSSSTIQSPEGYIPSSEAEQFNQETVIIVDTYSASSLPPTETMSPTYTTTPTSTRTPTVTNTNTVTVTPTDTSPPPTPSGEDAIYIYAIQDKTDDPKACDYIAVRINTGAWRSNDTASNIKRALSSLFIKRQYFGASENPAYLSNISVDSVEFKPYSGLVSIRLSGTYVRSGDRCDDSKVRAQVWSTIRQFPEVKSIDILLNGNLLGDILATGRK